MKQLSRLARPLRAAIPVRQYSLKPLSTSISSDDNNLQVVNARREGDNIDDNYSLLADEVVNSRFAFRNSRVSTIINQLPAKVEGGKILLKGIDFVGTQNVVESGESIPHEEFNILLESTRKYLSTEKDLFFEDAGLGACSSIRIGTRVISDNPAHALIFRSLLINIPPRVSRHIERFNGWNIKNHISLPTERVWNGSTFDLVRTDETPRRGQRPVVAYIGGNSNVVGIQFEQLPSNPSVIAGANIVAGGQSSIRSIVDALSIAAAAIINVERPHSLAVPSLVVQKDGKTTAVIGNISNGIVAKASSSESLYGAYCNVFSTTGVSAVFNGAIVSSADVSSAPFSGFTPREPHPHVVSNDSSVKILNPDNSTFPVSTFIFIGPEPNLTVDEAAAKLTQHSGDETKLETARSLLTSAKIVVVKSEDDVVPLII